MDIQYLFHTKIVIVGLHVILKVAIFHSQNLIFKTSKCCYEKIQLVHCHPSEKSITVLVYLLIHPHVCL